ncbi:MAG: hemD, partial [Phenylobacterium sp.]|nr:hemD [Phenylobacterium sp.]
MPGRRKKIWITRAQPGADATAERVRGMGHQALVAPLLAVRR